MGLNECCKDLENHWRTATEGGYGWDVYCWVCTTVLFSRDKDGNRIELPRPHDALEGDPAQGPSGSDPDRDNPVSVITHQELADHVGENIKPTR